MKLLPRAEILLPITIVMAAAILGASEFMVTFELGPPGGEAFDELTAASRHSYALLILAIFAVASMFVAIGTGLRVFATATAAFGVAALIFFLVLDLPDAGKFGTVGGDDQYTSSTAKAEPKEGFVAEALGSVILGLATVAFATLSSTQLRAPVARFAKRRAERTGEADEPAETSDEPKRRRRAKRTGRGYSPFDVESKDR